MIKISADLHTHTIVSGHAFSTLQEMVTRAAELHLELFGITEHAPSIPGAADPFYYRNLRAVPRDMYGVHLVLGSELNILDTKGTLDLDSYYYSLMDIRIAGIHSACYKGGTRDENTEGMINAIKNPWTDIISHPGDGTAELDFEPIVLASRDNNTLLEINNSSLDPRRHKDMARPNNLEILRLCKKYDVPVILGSDAHISFSVADYSRIWPLLEEAEFPDALVMNDKPDRILHLLSRPRPAAASKPENER